jgi:phosphoribosylglycinamide formyltransferase-1
MTTDTKQRFVSERITPVTSTADTAAMANGGPGLPREFAWRGSSLEIVDVLRAWRETGPCTHGSAERYVRKHWFEVVTADGLVAQLYFERRPRGNAKARWWLYTIGEPED